MRKEIKKIFKVVNAFNKKKGQWSYLTSIEYMLKSKLYIESLYKDGRKVCSYLDKGSKILDFGTGSGIFAIIIRNLNKDIKISGIDTSCDESQKNPNFRDTALQQKLIWSRFSKTYQIDFNHYDGFNIPFEDNSFDIILANAVFEHIIPGDLDTVLFEIKRVLKNNGLVFVFKLPRKLAYTEYLSKILKLGHHEVLYSDLRAKTIFKNNGYNIYDLWKSHMVIDFPGKVTNNLYFPLRIIDYLLYYSPFRMFAHHNNFILENRK